MHHLDADDGAGRLQLFFAPLAYTGEITNMEPNECSALRWWPVKALAEETVNYTRATLAAMTLERLLSAVGFPA